jgi:hypothetical protein
MNNCRYRASPINAAARMRAHTPGHSLVVCHRKSPGLIVPRVFKYSGTHTAPTLIMPFSSGTIQNQPCSNQRMPMLPWSRPVNRTTLLKRPKIVALPCLGFFFLSPKRVARNVLWPVASTSSRARDSWRTPCSSTAITCAPASKLTAVTHTPSCTFTPFAALS